MRGKEINMKENKASLIRTTKILESYFSIFNESFYSNMLVKPIITIVPAGRKHVIGWCSAFPVWIEKDSKTENQNSLKYLEINICAEALSMSNEDVAEIMLHEMAHLYNVQIGVNDTSRGGYYHNKHYKEAAEAHGLIVRRNEYYGWSDTSLSNEARSVIKDFLGEDFKYFKSRKQSFQGKGRKQNDRKYICPKCGTQIFSSKKEVHIKCLDCNAVFVKAENAEKGVM